MNVLLTFISAADVEAKAGPACGLECKYLTSDDYRNILWTSFADVPGELVPPSQDMWLPALIFSCITHFEVLFSRSDPARFPAGPHRSEEELCAFFLDVFLVFVAHVCLSREVRQHSLLSNESS